MLYKKSWIGLGVIVLIVGPVIINALMFNQSLFNVRGDFNIWIPSLSTYYGAILGGVISGILTLLGVRYTINENRKKDIQDSIPRKLFYLENIIFALKQQHKLLVDISNQIEQNQGNFSSEKTYHGRYRERVNYIVEYLEDDKFLDNSSQINLEVYKSIRELYDYIKEMQKNYDIYPYVKFDEQVQYTISILEQEKNKLLEKIDKF